MSAAELISWCGRCNSTHPVNGPCPVPPPGGGTEAAPVRVVDLGPQPDPGDPLHVRHGVGRDGLTACYLSAEECDTTVWDRVTCRDCLMRRPHVRDAGSGHLAGLPAVEAVRPWVERCQAAEAEVARLKGLIERDRTGLAAGLDAVRKRLASSFWLANEGEWGSYEYHERTERAWRGEVRRLLEDADSLALAALRASGDRVTEAFHGPAGPGERESLRASLDAANAECERQRDEARAALDRANASCAANGRMVDIVARERDEACAAVDAANRATTAARTERDGAVIEAGNARSAHAAALAVLRRLRQAAVADRLDPTPARLREWHAARDAADALLAAHPAPEGD